MVIGITPAQQMALADAQLAVLAGRVAAVLTSEAGMAPSAELDRKVAAWLREGRDGGVESELDLARLCLVLAEVDARGKRPSSVQDRLGDPDVGGELKVFQVAHAWAEHLDGR